jgi:cytochrome P450
VSTLHDRIDTIVSTASTGDPEPNLFSIMLTAGLDPERIRDELIALLFAGYDSTATALAVTLGLLGDHLEIQRRLRRELTNTLDGRTPTPDDLDDLPLLDAVVRESLRLYPPQYILFREPTGDRTLAGHRIDRGSTVVLSPWVSQRDTRFWDAPEEFRPDRWLDGGTATERNRPEFAYYPYGGGPRYCLGKQLADQTIRLIVAVICQRRQLQRQGVLSVAAGPTLSPGTVPMRTFRDHDQS